MDGRLMLAFLTKSLGGVNFRRSLRSATIGVLTAADLAMMDLAGEVGSSRCRLTWPDYRQTDRSATRRAGGSNARRPHAGRHQRLERGLQLRRHLGGDGRGAAGAVLLGTALPPCQVGILVGGALAHRKRVDELLEPRRQGDLGGSRVVDRLDERRDALPRQDAITGHRMAGGDLYARAHSTEFASARLTKPGPLRRLRSE